MASRLLKTVTPEEDTELKEAAENLNARKSIIKWVRVFEKNMGMILLEQLDKVLERFFASACKQNVSPMILKSNCNGFLVKLGNNFTCILSKLFPYFTRHHLTV